MRLRNVYESWGRYAGEHYLHKQWLLSKWEVSEGIEWNRKKIEAMLKQIATRLALKKHSNLADLGCGGGWISKALSSKVKNVVGLDFSMSMLKSAARLRSRSGLVCAEIGKLPFKDNAFDRALSYFVFINILEDRYVERSILEIWRVLKKGGRALIGQLPDKDFSKVYDRAKEEYLEYCRTKYKIGRNNRRVHLIPLKLFDRAKLLKFLKGNQIPFKVLDSFNPFYRPGAALTFSGRFDLILEKRV